MKSLTDDRTLIAFEVSRSIDDRARLAAARLRVSKSEVIRRGLIDFLARLEPGEAKPCKTHS